MKAIMITSENQASLANRYATSDLDMFPIGYILVTNFGDNGQDRYCGVVTQSVFDRNFVKVGNIHNGFSAIAKKAQVTQKIHAL